MKKDNQRGVALIIAVFATVFTALLISAMLDLVYTDTRIMENRLRSQAVYYAAEAGLETVYAILKDNPNWTTGFTDIAFPKGSSTLVTVTVDNTNFPNIDIVSTARDAGYRKTIRARFRISGASSPYYIYITKRW